MSRTTWSDNDDDDDDYGPDDDGHDDEETIVCPSCGESFHEDAGCCPHCNHWITAEDRRREPQPLWIVITVGACLAVVISWILMR